MTAAIEAAFTAFIANSPELRTSQAGKSYLTFTAGVGEGDAVQWVRVAVFGDRAQELDGVLHKGSKVYCEGRIRLDEWIAKDGAPKHGLSVAAFRIEPLNQIGRNRPHKPKQPRPTAKPYDRPFDDPLDAL
jgi:single-stranded DNA-binding protein